NREIRKKFEMSDLFILTSLFEGFPNVLLEAQAAGMPIVATDIPHVSDLINSDNAYLFQPRDYKQLGNIFLKLYRNEEELCRLSQASLRTSAEFFSKNPFEINAQVFREIYAESRMSKDKPVSNTII
ncbi:MAG: glycosyltransferase, partial [Candidatus Omnitrophota bacterium]|nr:glycosyltransferase [Candidatus Omnitrophota bacterium]